MPERHPLSEATSVRIFYEDDEETNEYGVDVRAAETYDVAAEVGGGRYVAEGAGVWVATADVDDDGNVAPGGAVLRPDVAPLLPACDPAHLHTLKGTHKTPATKTLRWSWTVTRAHPASCLPISHLHPGRPCLDIGKS